MSSIGNDYGTTDTSRSSHSSGSNSPQSPSSPTNRAAVARVAEKNLEVSEDNQKPLVSLTGRVCRYLAPNSAGSWLTNRVFAVFMAVVSGVACVGNTASLLIPIGKVEQRAKRALLNLGLFFKAFRQMFYTTDQEEGKGRSKSSGRRFWVVLKAANIPVPKSFSWDAADISRTYLIGWSTIGRTWRSIYSTPPPVS